MQSLTTAEEDIMRIIWKLERCTVRDIRDHIHSGGEPLPPHSTISTFVRILETKGFVDHKAYGRTHEYFPTIKKEDYSKRSLGQLVKDYFNGSVNQLVSFLVKEEKIDKEELADLLKKLEDEK
ncbi:MAG: BlaI/MecI/CopY family transcriptional regulator [Saprospiraceae bacterium]